MDDRQLIDSLLEMPMSELIAVLSKRGQGMEVEIEVEPKKKKLKGLGPLRMRENKRGGMEEDGGWDSPDSQDDQQHINSSYS